jgi:MFS transporter, FSR family, fosmidomycin resistance protein
MGTTSGTATIDARHDVGTIGLVGLAHGTSHFFHLLLPPLFPAFIRDFSLTYSEFGLLVTVFFVISGIGQALAGFLVDRVGARPVLFTALSLFVAASLAVASAQGYGGLLLAAALAGLGNSPFHPADFTILNQRVSAPRIGHAYSAHGISGNLGWALAPAFLVGVTALAGGQWRVAYLGTAAIASGVLVLLIRNRDAIDDRARTGSPSLVASVKAAAPEHPLAFLRLPSVWLCFSFFFWTTAALSAIQSFAGPALGRIYGLPLSVGASVVTGYMLCGALGMVAGGFLVGRTERLERTVALSMAWSGVLLLLVATAWPAPLVAAASVALAGLGSGIAGPSRDMLIRGAAPPGATGRVYGTVYSGLDAGFALAAPIFGWLLDHDQPRLVFAGSALVLVLGIVSAAWVAVAVRGRGEPAVPPDPPGAATVHQ